MKVNVHVVYSFNTRSNSDFRFNVTISFILFFQFLYVEEQLETPWKSAPAASMKKTTHNNGYKPKYIIWKSTLRNKVNRDMCFYHFDLKQLTIISDRGIKAPFRIIWKTGRACIWGPDWLYRTINGFLIPSRRRNYKRKYRRSHITKTYQRNWSSEGKIWLSEPSSAVFADVWLLNHMIPKDFIWSIYEMRGVDAINVIHGISGFRAYKPLPPKLIKW